MKTGELKEAEIITRDVVKSNLNVFATESPLAVAKDVQGLRAIFEEVCSNFKTKLSLLLPFDFCLVSSLLIYYRSLHGLYLFWQSAFVRRCIQIQFELFPLIIRFSSSLMILKLDTKPQLNFAVERKLSRSPIFLSRLRKILSLSLFF